MSRVWSKFDEKGLARFVVPDATRRIRLPINRADVLNRPDGRRNLAEAIYTRLLDAGIRYAPEKYHPEQAEQEIRSASELLTAPGEGTCLDLAALYAGLCMGFELLPVVIVTETHALCAVSLAHGGREWDAFNRPERQVFDEPVREPATLRRLVEQGSYLAIECTGFAFSETMPPDSIEGRNRHAGILSFPQAVEAGSAQLERDDSPIRFAIDVAVAHHHWKMTPPTLPPDLHIATEELVASEVEAGLRLEKVQLATAVRPYVRPVVPIIGPPRGFINRETEVDRATSGTRSEKAVWLTGPRGIGKTALLRRVASDDRAFDYQDGKVYLRNIADFTDAAQQIWESFFDSDPGYKPSLTRIAQSIGGFHALVMLDEVDPTAAEPLFDLMPNAGFVAVPATPNRGAGAVVNLDGLRDDDALTLFGVHLGRDVNDDERASVLELCRLLEGRPAPIIDAARQIADGKTNLPAALAAIQISPEGSSGGRLTGLDSSSRMIVILLKAFENSGLQRTHIEAMVPGDYARSLRELVDSHVLETTSPRYSLAATDMGQAVHPEGLERVRQQAVRYFADWVPRADLEDVAVSLSEIAEVIDWARHGGDWESVLTISNVAAQAAALSRRWGLWNSILQAARDAAMKLGDQSSLAYSLHQLGTRARLLGDKRTAKRLLGRARRIRRRIGEGDGADLSAHNLRFARNLMLPWLAGAALIATLGGGAAAVCSFTDLCGASPEEIEVTISPTSVEFGGIRIGASSPSETLTVSNTGEAPVEVALTELEEAFVVAGDCPEVLAADSSCVYVVTFAPTERRAYSAVLTIDISEGDLLEVMLEGEGLEPAAVTIVPPTHDFGFTSVGADQSYRFVFVNSGDEPARIDGPTVEGEFFTIDSEGCDEILDRSSECEVIVAFRPQRELPDGAEDRIHQGVLNMTVKSVGTVQATLLATSGFPLADLSIEIQEAIPIGRTALMPEFDDVPSGDFVVVRVRYTISNFGRAPAEGFNVTAEWFDDAWSAVDFTDDSAFITPLGSVRINTLVDPEKSVEFIGWVLIPRSVLDPKSPLPLRLVADTCPVEELLLLLSGCAVPEVDESNNISRDVDANPIIGTSDVALERRREDNLDYATFRETNLADLVADALQWLVDNVAIDQSLQIPVAVVDAGTLVPPGADDRTFIAAGSLTMLDLVDIAPRGLVVVSAEVDSGDLARLFESATSKWGTGAFPHIADGGRMEWCFTGSPYVRSLDLRGQAIVASGTPVQGDRLAVITTERFIDGTYGEALTGFERLPKSATVAEVLADYVGEGLDGSIGRDDIRLGRIEDLCQIP